MKRSIKNSVTNSKSTNPQSEYEYRKNVYLKRKHEFETLGEDDNNDMLSREEKMNIAKAEMDKVNPKSVKSSKDATFKTDKRLSPTSERYKGYLIVLDRGGNGYNVYDKHRELEDAGYPSKEAAKNFIDELVANDDVYSADAVNKNLKNSKDKVNAGIDGWDNRTGVIKRIDKYLYDNPEAIPPKGYIQPGSRAYDDAVSRYGDYVTTPFGNISTDDLMQYARDNKLLIDEDDIEASEAVDDIEREFQRIDRSGTDEEVAIAAIMYNLGTTMREAREILPTLSEDKIKDYVDYYYLRDLPTSERVKIWNNRKNISSSSNVKASNDYINSAYEYFDKVYGKCISEANQDINTIRRMYANNEGAPSTILLNLGYTADESGEAFTKSMNTEGHTYETVFDFAKYDWEDGPVLMYVLRDGEVPKGWTVTKFDLYDEEGNVISSATDPYSEEDDPVEFNSVEDYLKYNIEEGYIDWLSLPSEENDDFDNDDFDNDDFYDIVYQIESAIAKVTRGGGYKICVPNQFEEENGAFCAVIANGKRYAVEGIGNTWILSESDESVESCSNVKSLVTSYNGSADEEDEYDIYGSEDSEKNANSDDALWDVFDDEEFEFRGVQDVEYDNDGDILVVFNHSIREDMIEPTAEDLLVAFRKYGYPVHEWNTNGSNVFILSRGGILSSTDTDFNEYEDDIQEISQEFTSENTSINSTKLPAIFKMVSFEPGTTNIDYGGGRFDNVADYLTQYDVINLVYDPYNRTPEHNKEVIKTLRRAGGADTATCSNVLNVIKEPEVRKNVLENISKIVKPGGKVYITVYEGSGKGDEGPTKAGYQLNRRTADYLDEIREVFPDANRKGKLIVATNNTSVNSSTNIKASSTEGYVYTYCDECGKKNRVKVVFNNFNEPFNDTEYKCKYCGAYNLLTDSHSYDENGNVVEASDTSYIKNKVLYINTLRNKLLKAVQNTMLSWGFEKDEISDYSAVEVKKDNDTVIAEVRAEADYDNMLELAEACDPIVQSYDADAYFDMEQPGIMTAYIRNLSSINSSSNDIFKKDNKYMKLELFGKSFSVHYTEVDNSPEADPIKMFHDFKAQISMIKPYDDAEYVWADIADGIIRYIKSGKVIDRTYYMTADDWDLENYEWCDEVVQMAAQDLIELNKDIEPRMIHNSTDIKASMYEDEPSSGEEATEKCEFDIDLEDVHVIVNDDESWDFKDDDNMKWSINPDNKDGIWYSDRYNIYLRDPISLVEDASDVIGTIIPAVAGEYVINCTVHIVYDVEDISVYTERYPDGSYDEEIISDNAIIYFNEHESYVQITKDIQTIK